MKDFYKNDIIMFLTKKLGFIILIFNLIYTSVFSQNPVKESYSDDEKNFSEELFVITDRDLYIAGEKVWIKIYKLNGLTHIVSNLSKVVYIDILDIDNNPVNQLKIGIEGYSGSASFMLPDTLKTGNYNLRSYTNWMQNFSKDLFSYKRISVINPFENINEMKVPHDGQIPDSVAFYPEGGHLITGVETRLGLRSFNKNGDPVMLNGALIYENSDTICYVRTDKNGYGQVSIKPSGNKKILLVTKNSSSNTKEYLLPEIQNNGIAPEIPNGNENSAIFARIKMSNYDTSESNKLYMTLHSAGLINIRKEIIVERDSVINLLQKDLPDGLFQLMITDNKENLLADRWLYNDFKQHIKYNINLQNSSVSPRDRVELNILATDINGTPVESDFSISVAKAVTVNKNCINNIKYRQLPDLATVSTETFPTDINDLLLFYSCHDRFLKHTKISNNSDPLYLPELEGHLISGNIKSRKTGEPLRNENITLSFVGKVALCQFTKTDENGGFNFVTREQGTHEIVIQPLSPELKDCYVELNNPFASAYNNYNHESFYPDSSKLGEINNAIISMQINNIYEPFSQWHVKRLDSEGRHNFYGSPDKIIEISRYIELTSLKEVVKELIPGVTTIKNNGRINFKLIKKYPIQPFENSPLVLVDGVPVYDLEKVLSINSKDIDKIDVLMEKYLISDNVLEGILHFVSKRGNLSVIDLDRSVFRQEYEILQNKKEFYSPDYSADSLKNNRIPDFRNTLYWNPDLHTDKTGKTTTGFFTSDESAEYMITVEGITPDGRKGIVRIPLTVKSR
jgi:hypothetical protein